MGERFVALSSYGVDPWLERMFFSLRLFCLHVFFVAYKWGKMEPRCRQDAPSCSQDGQLEAIWGAILSIFGGLGSDL